MLLFNVLPIVDTCLSCEDIPTTLSDGAQMANFWRIFATCIFSELRAAVSDLHSEFALRPHHV